jgi:soluble P-type ATPase
MIEITISKTVVLQLDHVVLDYNGTLAQDGELIAGVTERLQQLSQTLQLHVLTADTHGTVQQKVSAIRCQLHVIGEGKEDIAKAHYLELLGADRVVAIGNGRNDMVMLKDAALGIAVLQAEGLSPRALSVSDILCKDINDALDLLLKPSRITATLRN